jgi:hypothetical protein
MEITSATIEGMDIVRALFREYQQWLGVGLCFQNFEKELNELPGCYRESEGAIFLAKEDGVAECAMQYLGTFSLLTMESLGRMTRPLRVPGMSGA